MDCQTAREHLLELVRGRLAPDAGRELTAHLAGCEACRREAEVERLLDQALTTRLPPAPAPEGLRRRLSGLLGEEAAPREAAPRRRRLPGWLAPLAAGLALVAAGYVAGVSTRDRAAARDRLVNELVDDHLRVLGSAHPHDVESSDAHQVKPWFEGRLDFAPVVPGDRGELRLLGGSIGYLAGTRVAVASYGLRRHRVTLLAFPRAVTARANLEGSGGSTFGPAQARGRGFEVSLWTAGEVGYALVGDVAPAELQALAAELAAETRR